VRADNVRVIDPTQIPRTSGTGTEPVPATCQEKLRLRMQFAAEARRFLQVLNGYLAPKNQSSVTQLHQKSTTDEARKACEQAMDALEAHRMAHGC
jgi:hypothetical protein